MNDLGRSVIPAPASNTRQNIECLHCKKVNVRRIEVRGLMNEIGQLVGTSEYFECPVCKVRFKISVEFIK